MTEWYDILSAPKNGTPVILMCKTMPDYGQHIMWWEKKTGRWETMIFAVATKYIGWWREDAEQPTHWRPTITTMTGVGTDHQ